MNLEPNIELLVDSQCAVGESLVWSPQDNTLWWVDITAKKLHRWQFNGQGQTTWVMPEMTGCVALCDDSTAAQPHLIAGMETGLFDIRFSGVDHATTHITQRCTVPHSAAEMRFNDGRCDRQGRLVAGTMTINQTVGVGNPSLYQYQNGQLSTLLADFVKPFTTPNGTAFSPDGRTFYLSDSHTSQQQVWAFDYDTDTGIPHNRRSFIDMNQHPGRPDGAAIDADGCYWICATDAGMIHRFTPTGTLDKTIQLPVKKPTICTWGGADLKTLYVASIRPSGIDLSDQPLAGAVFAIQGLGAQGVAEPVFKI